MPAPLLGFVCALRAEAVMAGRFVRPGDIERIGARALCIIGGPGRRNAADAASRLIEAGAGTLVSWGFAGSLHSRLSPGRLVLPRRVRHERDGRVFDVDETLWEQIYDMAKRDFTPYTGDLACTDDIVRTPADKRRLFDACSASAVDMESAGILEVANRQAVPSVVVRAIVDAHSVEIPAYIDAGGRFGTVARGLARQPGSMAALIALADGYRRARGTLRKLARRMTK